MRLLASCVIAVVIALSGGCALWWSDPPPARSRSGVLVDPRGMTLYTFDRDITDSGKSACIGPCAEAWPPFVAPGDARPLREFEPIGRDDGRRQWSYKGKPLYFWSKDEKAGDRTGDGFGNLWRAAKP